ncbi:hypothetical protein FXO38_11387 [Capsicum annuum]|nr:hypothetical protein FXO37_28450 [Capsicum annuum]KAF3662011.1 hypothetical protein FXO38_11387 [Capsicum annuum]
MVRRVHRAIKRPAPTTSTSRKRKSKEVLKTFERKKPVVDESKSETKSRILADISEYDKSSAHESEDAKDSEGKREGRSKEKSKSYSGDGEDRRDSEDGEEDPLSLPICARDISIELYGLTTWIDDFGYFLAKIFVRARTVVYREFRRIMHLYHTPTVREIEQRYMKTFKPYTDEIKDTSIDALKAQLKGVIVLTSSAKVADEDEDLGGHHYVPSPLRACDQAGSSGHKISPNASNKDELRERIAFLKKSLLDIASFIRDERLWRIEKNKKM